LYENIKEVLKECGAVKFGDFVLASGKRSRYYIDVRKAVTKPRTLRIICDHIVEKIKNHSLEPDYLACVELGGVPIGTLVADRTGLPLIIVRKEAKDHGLKGRLVGDFEKGKIVLLLEDVTTTGGSVLSAIKALKEEGLNIQTIITVVDRQEGAEEAMSSIGINLIPLTTAKDILLDDVITKELQDIGAVKDRDKEILLTSLKPVKDRDKEILLTSLKPSE
jgi:orotate phosphoribosyltransferase